MSRTTFSATGPTQFDAVRVLLKTIREKYGEWARLIARTRVDLAELEGGTFSASMTVEDDEIWRARLLDVLNERGISQPIRDRIIRLNPNWADGTILRGWHPHHSTSRERWSIDAMPKGEFIRRHGRAAWVSLPRKVIIKKGKHAYVPHRVVEDRFRA